MVGRNELGNDSIPGQLDSIRSRIGEIESELRDIASRVPREISALSNRIDAEENARMELSNTIRDMASRQRSIETQLAENTVLTRLAASSSEASGKRVDDAVKKIGEAADTLTALHNGRIWMGVNKRLGAWLVGLAIGVTSLMAAWEKLFG